MTFCMCVMITFRKTQLRISREFSRKYLLIDINCSYNISTKNELTSNNFSYYKFVQIVKKCKLLSQIVNYIKH